MAERVTGGGRPSTFQRTRDIWYSGISNLIPIIDNDSMLKACAAGILGEPLFWSDAGSSWVAGRYGDTLYNHVCPVNWIGSDCSADLPLSDPGTISGGAISARSFHPGGLNLLRMDGSVRFQMQSIGLGVWRALATRGGAEVESEF